MRCTLLYVYAHRDINIDEEITIWYSSGYIKEYFKYENIEEYIPTFKLENNYIDVEVELALGGKCLRCWKVVKEVKDDIEICNRCSSIVKR